MSKIVISYRRSDKPEIAYRILDWIETRYGKKNVFIDIDDMPVGSDFRQQLKGIVSASNVLLVIVGRAWVGPASTGRSRIHHEDDPVRMELEAALESGTKIIPILVDGASMPDASDLPETLKKFAYINAATVDGGRDRHHHMERLGKALDNVLNRSGPKHVVETTAVAVSADEDRDLNTVRSPMDGAAYRGRGIDGKFLVEVGRSVEAGQRLLIIDDMKNMNLIPAPYSGSVVKVLFEEGEVVKFGDPLMVILPPSHVTRFTVPGHFDVARTIWSPMVGTTYRSRTPGGRALIDIGSFVKMGDSMLVIEANTAINEIPAPQDGIVEQIFFQDDCPVEYGEPLLVLRSPLEAASRSPISPPPDWRAFPGLILSPMSAASAHRAPIGKTEPYVRTGDHVAAGDQLAVLEVMLTSVPVTTPNAGIITHILFTDGLPVESEQPLFVVKPFTAGTLVQPSSNLPIPSRANLGDFARYPGAVLSPMTGTAHRTRERESRPLVQIGSQVKAGDVLLTISRDEADYGEIFNEIPADRPGTVRRILFEDGEFVEFGAPLLILI